MSEPAEGPRPPLASGGLVRPEARPRGVRRLLNAVRNSWGGFKGAWREEEAFRQEILAGIVLVPLALWLGENGIERALMLGSLFVVLIVELLNSSIEATVDRIGTERHTLSGLAKDLGSAAVAVALLLVVVVWSLVLFD